MVELAVELEEPGTCTLSAEPSADLVRAICSGQAGRVTIQYIEELDVALGCLETDTRHLLNLFGVLGADTLR